MRFTISVASAVMLIAGSISVASSAASRQDTAGAQAAPATPPSPADAAPQGRGGSGARGFPAQQRPLAPPATIERGKVIYEINCRSCHGPDLRGGETGGPNLLRSQLALTDMHGELIMPVVKQGRQTPGMPAMPPLAVPDDDIVAVAEYIHAVQATGRGQGAPPPGPSIPVNILVGDAKEGEAYFNKKCIGCHTADAMQGLASRIPDPMQLQNTWFAKIGAQLDF